MSTPPASRVSRTFGRSLAALAWYGLLLQLYLIIVNAPSNGLPVATAVVNYFSFFTILTNLLVAVALTFSGPERASVLGSFCSRPTVQTAIAVYISIVGIVYSLVLRSLWDPEGLQKIADKVLHDAVPLLYVVYWALFVRKDGLQFRDVGRWLLYPAIYLVYTLIRGAASGRYPYHFLDAGQLGYSRVGANIVLLVAAFAVTGSSFVAIGRWMSRNAA